VPHKLKETLSPSAPGVHWPRLFINPDYRALIEAHSPDPLNAILDAQGEIISGHPDRHVLRVQIGAIEAILKREHIVPWKDRLANWRAGFGWCSASKREGNVLQCLANCGIAVPELIAAGESPDGRAFLLVRSLSPTQDLRRYLDARKSDIRFERRSFTRRLAQKVAEIHNLGFEYPDLYSKHVLIDARDGQLVFLDWQRGRRVAKVSWRTRCRNLAALNASLSDELADASDRFTFLRAYYRVVGDRSVALDHICRQIERRTRQLLRRSSIRVQRIPEVRESQSLVWLDGEALCATPMGQTLCGRDELERFASGTCNLGSFRSRVELRDGRAAVLVRRKVVRRLGRIADFIRQKHWISPEALHAANLLRRERLGESPRLLAFGQRRCGFATVESFLLALDGETQ
jgi:tRNA A-37 threonylcarbamoyl transferase component Bud32